MKNSILVCVETVEEAPLLLAKAKRLQDYKSLPLHMFSAIKPLANAYAEFGYATSALSDWFTETKAAHRANLLKALPELSEDQVHVVEGYPLSEIVECSKQADTLVMGMHQRRGLHRLLGSTTLGVLSQSDCPILAVHPDSGDEAYRTLLAPVDVHADDQPHLKQLSALLSESPHNPSYRLLSVVPPVNAVYASTFAYYAADYSLSTVQDKVVQNTWCEGKKVLAKYGLSIENMETRTGDPIDQIVAQATYDLADLIIMGARHRSLTERVVLGSTAHGVLQRSPCDVLVMPE